ncbi:Rid family hydrolase [Brevibacterium album]|uniref:Rid family hydrolase n=1 Tax=Brevibacterium album TaxID=417948 RepID=UPI0006853595|nr:Rid family hydrolase [Brevibacterium album]
MSTSREAMGAAGAGDSAGVGASGTGGAAAVSGAAEEAITKVGRVGGSGRPGIFLASAFRGLASACLTAPDKSEGVEGQTCQVLDRIEELLAETGADPAGIVMAQVWLQRIEDAEEFAAAWNAWLGERPAPALSLVQAPAAGYDSLVEIRAYAVRAERR